MTMCLKDVVYIHVLKKDDGDRLIEPQIIELEFKRDILDPHIIIGGESIQLRIKRERPTL